MNLKSKIKSIDEQIAVLRQQKRSLKTVLRAGLNEIVSFEPSSGTVIKGTITMRFDGLGLAVEQSLKHKKIDLIMVEPKDESRPPLITSPAIEDEFLNFRKIAPFYISRPFSIFALQIESYIEIKTGKNESEFYMCRIEFPESDFYKSSKHATFVRTAFGDVWYFNPDATEKIMMRLVQ